MQLPLSRASKPRPITTAADVFPDDEVIIFTPADPIAVNMPSASGARNALYMYNEGPSDAPVTLTPLAGTINGESSFEFTGPGAGMLLIPDGISNWMVVGASGLSGLVEWGEITGTLADQTDLQAALDLKSPLASPTFTGTPAAPTAAVNVATTQLATTAFVGILRNALATTVTYNNAVALAATALSVTVEAGKTYSIALTVQSTNTVKGLNLDFAGTATLTSFIGAWVGIAADGTVSSLQASAAGTDFGPGGMDAALTALYTFQGVMVVNAAGTFLLRGAQNVADVSNTTILAGSTLILTKID